MRRPWLLATTLLTQAAIGLPALAQPAEAPAAAVRVRTGQHADRGRVVLHLGAVPAHSLRKVANGIELRLRGVFDLDLGATRRLSELAGMEARRDGAETVLLLRAGPEASAESGAFGGMLYVDLRGPAVPPPTREAAQRRTLDEAVKLGLLQPDQARAMLQAAQGGTPSAPPPPVAAAAPPPPPPPQGEDARALAQATSAPRPAPAPAPAGELAGLREAVLARLAVLNGLRPADALPPLPALAAPAPVPAAEPAVPPPVTPPAPLPVVTRPSCPAPFALQGWAGEAPFAERLPQLRAALGRADQGAAETAALAEFYTAHELTREALEVLTTAQAETPAGALRERLERVRDIARLLLGRPVPPGSALLAEAPDCAREDLPLWRALAAATSGDAATLAALAPRARAALRDIPQNLRLALTQRLADAVDNDPATLRTLLGAIRPATGLTPQQAAARNWQYARLARQEGNRAEEAQYLELAGRAGGRSLPELYSRARLAALNLSRPGAEGRRAEAQVNDLLRTYRFDAVGEEAAVAYATRLLEQGALAQALAVADGASQASARRTESRGAVLAADALRRLLAEDQPLPPDERLGLFWQYEGYATPGERGDDIRLAAIRLLLRQGLADAARDLGQQLTPAAAREPAAALLLAQAEAQAAQGDPRRALALLGPLPPGDAARRVAAAALARLGRPEEAAAQLEPLRQTADLSRRAELLFEARAWRAAGSAYGTLLRDAGLPAEARADATSRLASASALAQQRPGVAAELLAPEAATAALLQLTETAAAPPAGIANVRNAIERSKRIEALLPPVGGT